LFYRPAPEDIGWATRSTPLSNGDPRMVLISFMLGAGIFACLLGVLSTAAYRPRVKLARAAFLGGLVLVVVAMALAFSNPAFWSPT
jgi:hypothetical protein